MKPLSDVDKRGTVVKNRTLDMRSIRNNRLCVGPTYGKVIF